MRSSTLETVSPYATGHVLGLTDILRVFRSVVVIAKNLSYHPCPRYLDSLAGSLRPVRSGLGHERLRLESTLACAIVE